MHSHSNFRHSIVSSTYYVSKTYLGNIDFLNLAKLSASGGIFAGTGFLPDLEKCRIPAGAGAEIRYSPSYMGDSFYRSKDPTNSIKVLKEMLQRKKQRTKTTKSHIYTYNNRRG